MIPSWDAAFLDLERQIDQMFDELIYRRWAVAGRRGWRPLVDVHQTGEEYIVDVALPGVAPADIQVLVTPRDLTVTGERTLALPSGVLSQHCECPQGSFRRVVRFVRLVDPQAARAEYHHGVCRVYLPLARSAAAPQSELELRRSQWVIRVSVQGQAGER